MQQIILGFVGQAGAGKGTAGEIIQKKYPTQIFTFSDILKDILNRLFLESSRDNLIKLSINLRETFGQDILAQTMEKQVTNSKSKIIIVDGIRRLDDIKHLQKKPNFYLIQIETKAEIRFQRLKKRNQKPGEKDMTWEQFLEMSQKETEKTIQAVAKNSQYTINNNQDLEYLQKQLQEIIQKIEYENNNQ